LVKVLWKFSSMCSTSCCQTSASARHCKILFLRTGSLPSAARSTKMLTEQCSVNCCISTTKQIHAAQVSCMLSLCRLVGNISLSRHSIITDTVDLFAQRNSVSCQWSIWGQSFLFYPSPCKGKGKAGHRTTSHSYRVSLAIWDHTVLPATRHK